MVYAYLKTSFDFLGFAALLMLHEVLKCNLDLVQDVYMRTSNIKSSSTLQTTFAEPKLNGSPMMLFANENVFIKVRLVILEFSAITT